MKEYELLLFDRIEMIKTINQKYDLEHNAYISFSGGKDSTILHHLIDIALPGNKIPRVFINTGIEYLDVVKFVRTLAEKDERIHIVSPSQSIRKVLEEHGYPFKSKIHSKKLDQYQRGFSNPSIIEYITSVRINNEGKIVKPFHTCPKSLLHQFDEDYKLKISEKCCDYLKKKPASKWMKENNKKVIITGMRNSEGGARSNINCITTKNNKLEKFHPLIVVSDEWENWFIEEHNIKLCELYYPPYNFYRTGCKGCPFALELQEQLDVMKELLPNEYKQCENLWKPVYEEYRRIGYRLRGKEHESNNLL